jgi:hypothetical protein
VDYALDTAECSLVESVSEVAARCASRPEDSGGPVDWDVAVDDELAGLAFPGGSLLHRLLVVEEAARAGLPALPGPRLLAAPEVLGEVPRRPVAVVPRRRRGPVRLPSSGGLLLTFDGPDASVAEVDGSLLTAVASSSDYPYAEVVTAATSQVALQVGAGETLRARWYLMLAAEIAGTARGGLQHTVRHLDGRVQFGRRLSSFQALRHRVADLAVSTEAVVWLARESAWRGDVLSAGTALGFARDLAASMAPELVQLCGARGFVTDFPVHRFAMRLEALRLEAGSADRLSSAVWGDLRGVAEVPRKDAGHPGNPGHPGNRGHPSDPGPQRG